MDHIQEAVDALYNKYQTRCPYELAEHLEIEIFEYAFRKIRGLFLTLEGRKIIGVKSDLPPCEKRAVIAHEIGHAELHPKNAGHFFVKEHTGFSLEKYEHEADLFAAMLLVDERPEYGETMASYAARQEIPLPLVKVLWESKNRRRKGAW